MALTIDTQITFGITGSLSDALSHISTSLGRLSSGLRVNSAQDDPAGLAVASELRAKSRTLTQAKRNATDAVSLLQTAGGSLDVIDEKLVRMKELAEQSATGTYTAAQRTIMQSEFALMGTEIDRIAGTTTFNGTNLLDGSLASTATRTTSGGWREPNGGLQVQVEDGSDRDSDYYFVTVPKTDTAALFAGSTPSIATQSAAQSALTTIDSALIRKDNAQTWLGSQQNRLEGTIDELESRIAVYDQAESDIMDADIVTELTDYVANSVLAESATAMLAQANLVPRLALSLIEGL